MILRSLICGFAGLALCIGSVAHAQSPDMPELHDALHLTASQEDAWRAYRRDSSPDPMAASRHRSATQMMASLPTPRRIDLVNAEMESDLVMMKRQGDAVKAFYAQLSPEQQHTFDRQTLQSSNKVGDTLRQPKSGQSLPPPHQ